MTIHEPITVATDCLLALASLIFGVLLWRRGDGRAWPLMFFFTATGTLFGGLFHGLEPGTPAALTMWKATAYSIGLASFFMLVGAVPRRWATLVGLALFMAYATWMIEHNSFLWVLVDYGLTLLVIVLVHATSWLRRRTAESPWLAGAVVVSLAAAAVQQSALAIGPVNHNDLFHVVQLAGLWMLYRGALIMTTTRAGATIQPA